MEFQKIQHWMRTMTRLLKNKKEREFLDLIKGRDYNEVMQDIRVAEWLRANSYGGDRSWE